VVLLATQPNSWRLGVVIVFDGYTFAATHAVKQDSWSLHAFSAKEAGALARIAPTQVQWINWPAWRYACRGTDLDPAVHLLWFVAGMDAPASLPSDLRGLVVAASGIGNVNAAITASIAGLRAQHIPVLVATRTGSGPVFPFYGGGGGSTTLREMGVQFTNLHPLKARLLIMAALKSSDPWSEILTGHPWGPDEA
jgi:L-asparaginase